MDTLLPHAVGVMQRVLKTTLVKDMDVATVGMKVGAYATCMREYTDIVAVKEALLPACASAEAAAVLDVVYQYLPSGDAHLPAVQQLWYIAQRYRTVHEAALADAAAWRRIRRIIEAKLFAEFPAALQNTVASLWGQTVLATAAMGALDAMRQSEMESLLEVSTVYNAAVGRWKMMDGFVSAASDGYEISTELLVLQAASARARGVASTALKNKASPLVQGVILEEAVAAKEADFADALLPLIATVDLPIALPSMAKHGDLVWADLCASHTLAGTALPSGFSGAADDWRAYYLNAFAAFSATTRLTSVSAPLARPHPQPPQLEWRKGLWEASENAQLAHVLDLLGRETFAVPMDVWSPFSSYEDEPEPVDPATRTVLTSKFGGQVHHFLNELREDCESAMERRLVGEDYTGQWAAARDVVTSIRGMATALMAAVANHFHTKVETFGHADNNMLPFLLLLSDVFSISLLHFTDPVLAVLIPAAAAPPQPPQKLNPKVMAAVAGCREGPDATENLTAVLTKIAVLIGVALDKLRGDMGKMVLRAFQHYGDVAAAAAHVAELKSQTLGMLEDGDDGEGGGWVHEHSPNMDYLLNTMLHPIACLSKQIASELALHLLKHAVDVVVETVVSKVAAALLPSRCSWDIPDGGALAWLDEPPAAAAQYPMAKLLHSDLVHLRKYLMLHLEEYNLVAHDVPCWGYPGGLYSELAR
eukprot:TRINITY_DN5443_c0_g7_i1.p1 TRINITY_DN5443_c0_g7~~TRINITY_DN5443_c0_g7_i1.p1  ORF type:complete len:728 (+),score=276.32 TRINITY_DN5443_c0_g7_i1:69-2186(+)